MTLAWGPLSALKSGSTRGAAQGLQVHLTESRPRPWDLTSSLCAADPYQILGPTSSRLANPGEVLPVASLRQRCLGGSEQIWGLAVTGSLAQMGGKTDQAIH